MQGEINTNLRQNVNTSSLAPPNVKPQPQTEQTEVVHDGRKITHPVQEAQADKVNETATPIPPPTSPETPSIETNQSPLNERVRPKLQRQDAIRTGLFSQTVTPTQTSNTPIFNTPHVSSNSHLNSLPQEPLSQRMMKSLEVLPTTKTELKPLLKTTIDAAITDVINGKYTNTKSLENSLTALLSGPAASLINKSITLSQKVKELQQVIQLQKTIGPNSTKIKEVKSMIDGNRKQWKKEGQNQILNAGEKISIHYEKSTKSIYVSQEKASGLYNSVSLGFNWDTGTEVAIRQTRLGSAGYSDSRSAQAFAATKNLNNSQTPGLVRFDQRIPLNGGEILIMEKMKGRELQTVLEGPPLTPQQGASIAKGLITTLAAMHSKNATHGDLSAQNLFVDNSPTGMNTTLFDMDTLQHFPNSPETLTKPLKEEDVTQLGKILYAIANQKTLKGAEISVREMKQNLISKNLDSNKDSLELISRDLLMNPKKADLSAILSRLEPLLK